MKIEEINIKNLSNAPDKELYVLHLRFIQLWNKNFAGNRKIRIGSLERGNFLDKYKILIKEMDDRKLTYSTQGIDRSLFRKSIYGLDTSALGDVVITPDYVSVGGSFVKSPKEANDLDLIIRDDESNRDEGMELKLSRLMQKQVKKDCHFVYNKTGAHSTYLPLFDLVIRGKDEVKRVEVKEDYNKAEELEKGCRPAFGSPGGKRYLAKTIVSYIPEHKTYVEPFIGGGAVFFAKEPSEAEVINDLDKEIAFAYRFIKNMSDEQFKTLKSKDWKASKMLFNRLKELKNEEPVDKFRKIIYLKKLYLKKLSYGESGKNYDQTNEGRDLAGGLDNLLRIRERLKNVKIENNDYEKSINYDSKETFYYLDPPYPETSNVGNIDLMGLHKFCKNLKGKYILSLNNNKKNVDMFKDFNIKKVKVSQQMFTGGSQMQMRTELLISNFPLKKENIYLAKSEKGYFEGLDSLSEDLLIDNYNVIKELEEGSVLDLGCGTGRLGLLLKRSGRKVEGIDNSDIAIRMCEDKDLKVKKLNLEKGKLPYEDNQFDNVIMVHCLEHLENPEEVIKEAQRIANKKVIILSPLGEREDATHKQKYLKLKDFEVIFNEMEY